MIRLSDEEIKEVDNALCSDPLYLDEKDGEKALLYSIGQFNKAQLKKVVDWGNEECPHSNITFNLEKIWASKQTCSKCWQALLEEIK